MFIFCIRKACTDKNLALRVEWCKAYTRLRRLHEDIVLVDEEMWRTIGFGAYMAKEWRARAAARTAHMSPALAEGLRAYALEHARREEQTAEMLTKRWTGLRQKAAVYLAGVPEERDTEGEMQEVVVDVDLDEEDPDDKEGDVAGDEEVDADAGEADDEDEVENM